jgi:hypothetical protein
MITDKLIRLIFAAGLLGTTAHAATIAFNFDSDNLGTSTTFTDSSGGLSATFSSSADPGGFVIYSSTFDTLTGNVLGDPGPAGIDGLALTVNFSESVTAVTLNFATADFSTPSPFTLTAYENGVQVGSNTSSGMFLNGFVFPEGEIAFQGAGFNSIVLSSPAMDFAVDNITVATPEPGTYALFGTALMAIALPLRRRKR